ncbi:MAG: 1-acyl-sn-glycerol-3-phosphate acyltransferase [Planctomycetales bacterium]|nr:1-acyl-sn-glycerol-3-phosphate acyltransferase [Planctomycetales bacterium]
MTAASPTLASRLLRGVTRWIVGKYYRQIKVTGGERIPQQGAVLLCGNHPNSLLDPVVIGIASRRPVRFMAKAPLFKTPVLGRLMYALGMIPAFRGQDDARQVRRNVESLDQGAKVLATGAAMGIFPEGKSHDAMQLEMVRSGAGRMAVGALQGGAGEVTIVPIGLVYERKEQFRSAVWVDVGEPIATAQFFGTRELGDRKALRELTEELGARLKRVVVHLDDPLFEDRVHDLEMLFGSGHGIEALQLRKRIADGINRYSASEPDEAAQLSERIGAHRRKLQQAGLPLDAEVLGRSPALACLALVMKALGLGVLFPIAVAATVFHLVPFAVTRLLARLATPPGRTAVSFYRLLIGLPVYLIWYLAAVAFALWQAAPWSWIVPGVVALAPAGVMALSYWPAAPAAVRGIFRQLSMAVRPTSLRPLRDEHAALRSALIEIGGKYATD